MSAVVLEAKTREKVGKSEARSLRRSGQVPAVIYGGKDKEVLVSLEAKGFTKELHKPGFHSKVFDIKVGNQTIKALPKVVDFNPVTDVPEHADFLRVNKGEKIKVFVKTEFKNAEKSPGLKRGGILNIVRREIEILCEMDKIPAAIEIDLAGLEIGHSVHINDIKLPEGVSSALRSRNFTIATVAGRITEEQELAKDAARAAAVASAQAELAAKDAEAEAKKAEEKKAKEDKAKK